MSYSVNQGTRQTRERKIYCQAESENANHSIKKNQPIFWLPEDRTPSTEVGIQPGDQTVSCRVFFFSLSFFLNYFTLFFSFKKNDSHSDSVHKHFKVQARKHEAAYLCGCKVCHISLKLPASLRLPAAVTLLVIWWQQVEMTGDGLSETIRQDSNRPAGMFQVGYADVLLKCGVKKE